jgi:hypothetical protein
VSYEVLVCGASGGDNADQTGVIETDHEIPYVASVVTGRLMTARSVLLPAQVQEPLLPR